MINGLYSGAAAMEALAQQQELISSNLMHVNTSGHRRAQPAMKQRFDASSNQTTLELGPEVETMVTDFTQGRHSDTGRPLDVAISGDGFFEFQKDDQTYLSRNGRLYRDSQSNQLVNADGDTILGTNGPITIDAEISDRELAIGNDGTITAGTRELGRIQAVAFENNQDLESAGPLNFSRTDQAIQSDAEVRMLQNTQELSNVQPVNELIALIINTRHHEAIEKATRTLAESLQEYIRN